MFGSDRRGPFADLFSFQRDFDRLFHNLWTDLSTRGPAAPAQNYQVRSADEGWQIEVPIPGIDPAHVTLEAAGTTVAVRAEVPGQGKDAAPARFEQTFTLPSFLDLDRLAASYRHGMLYLTVPLKESVKPRRIQIETAGDTQRQLTGTAA